MSLIENIKDFETRESSFSSVTRVETVNLVQDFNLAMTYNLTMQIFLSLVCNTHEKFQILEVKFFPE